MNAVKEFSVLTTGKVQPGFDADDVESAFVKLLNSTPEKAHAFVSSEQCIASDLTAERAEAYQEALVEIGLDVTIVPSHTSGEAANDESADEPSTATDISEAAHNQRHDDGEAADSEPVDSRTQLPIHKNNPPKPSTNRPLRLLLLGVVAAAVGLSVYLTRGPTIIDTGFGSPTAFHQVPRGNKEIETLISVSGLDAEIEQFSESLTVMHQEYFTELRNTTASVTQKKYQMLMEDVPKAYNAEALHSAMGNWLQRTMFEFDVTELIEMYNMPSVKKYVIAASQRNPSVDPAGFEEFKERLNKNPLSEQRRQALIGVVDSMSMDDAVYNVSGDVQRNLIATAGQLRADKNTPAAKDRVREEIKAMRVAMNWAKPEIRNEVILTLAWQYEGSEVSELHTLRDAVDRSVTRGLVREVTLAYEAFLRDATIWLHRQIDD